MSVCKVLKCDSVSTFCHTTTVKLQQLRYLCQVVDSELNVTAAAQVLHTSQSGISRQIRLLERELGADILVRHGNRIVGLTEPGRDIVMAARQMLAGARDLAGIAAGASAQDRGELAVGTPHLHARYALPPVVSAFRRQYPDVRLRLVQRAPAEVDSMVVSNEVDIGITSGTDEPDPGLVMLPAYRLPMSLIARAGHPLLGRSKVTLADIARFPLIAYDVELNSRRTVGRAFERAGIEPDIVLSATDADVIKAYVASGLGIAVLQSMAFDPDRDIGLEARPVDHIFPASITYILLRRGKYLRRYQYDFIAMLADGWTAERVRAEVNRKPAGAGRIRGNGADAPRRRAPPVADEA
jgi:LysR family transcriptional regulator, cys regulon transcriptional activator